MAGRLAVDTTGVAGLGEQRGLDGLDEERLIPELADLLALLDGHLAAHVDVGQEHVQQSEHLAGGDHGVHGHGVLCEVRLGTVQGGAGGHLLQRGLTHGAVGKGVGTLHAAHGDHALHDGAAGDGAFDHAGELLDNEGVQGAGLVGLVDGGDGENVVEGHVASLSWVELPAP